MVLLLFLTVASLLFQPVAPIIGGSAVAQSRERMPLAGDQLVVDMDLSAAHLPPGTRLAVGDAAVIEVTDQSLAEFRAKAVEVIGGSGERPWRGCGDALAPTSVGRGSKRELLSNIFVDILAMCVKIKCIVTSVRL